MGTKDTIFALSTPAGKSALAVFRISGSKSHKVIKKISLKKTITINKTSINQIYDEKKIVDQVVLTFFKSPKSFTGENMVEVSCHGGLATIKGLTNTFYKNGLRMADPGEFTRRALENNKVDLVGVEAIGDLVNANTEKQRDIAITNLRGELHNYTSTISSQIKKLLADIEAIIDFADEELPKNIYKKIIEQKENIEKSIKDILRNSSLANSIRNGFFVSIIGKPNSGKSSFINHVSGRNVSIVTDIPGTTTDLVESLVDINGFQIRLIDTAGLRRYKNKIEEIGIKKSIEASKESDLNIIFLVKNEKEQYINIKNKIFVRSKYDILKKKIKSPGVINISSKTGHGIEGLLKKTIDKLVPQNKYSGPLISRERQVNKLKNCLEIIQSVKFDKNTDMIADDIRSALKELDEIYHKFDIEQILDIIFNDFCIGK